MYEFQKLEEFFIRSMPNWSTEIFTIKKNPINKSKHISIKYKIIKNRIKIKHPDVYLVEKILRRTIKPS
jgi:hypothetical protein